MKFKAFLTHDGVNLLDKRKPSPAPPFLRRSPLRSGIYAPDATAGGPGFLPALDKVGRICHVYLTRDHAMFLHNLLNGDGVQCVAQFDKDLLFLDYRISSKNEDRIAFSLDLALLHRALRSALSILQRQGGCDPRDDGGSPLQIQIKLLKKTPAGSQQPTPFLSFETKVAPSSCLRCSLPILIDSNCDFSHANFAEQFMGYLRISSTIGKEVYFLHVPHLAIENLVKVNGCPVLSHLRIPSTAAGLTNSSQGHKSAVIHDVPISRPLSRDDVTELQAALDMAQQLPQVHPRSSAHCPGCRSYSIELFANTPCADSGSGSRPRPASDPGGASQERRRLAERLHHPVRGPPPAGFHWFGHDGFRVP